MFVLINYKLQLQQGYVSDSRFEWQQSFAKEKGQQKTIIVNNKFIFCNATD